MRLRKKLTFRRHQGRAEEYESIASHEIETNALQCPEGHALVQAAAKSSSLCCSACSSAIIPPALLWGCTTCSYNCCVSCGEKEQRRTRVGRVALSPSRSCSVPSPSPELHRQLPITTSAHSPSPVPSPSPTHSPLPGISNRPQLASRPSSAEHARAQVLRSVDDVDATQLPRAWVHAVDDEHAHPSAHASVWAPFPSIAASEAEQDRHSCTMKTLLDAAKRRSAKPRAGAPAAQRSASSPSLHEQVGLRAHNK